MSTSVNYYVLNERTRITYQTLTSGGIHLFRIHPLLTETNVTQDFNYGNKPRIWIILSNKFNSSQTICVGVKCYGKIKSIASNKFWVLVEKNHFLKVYLPWENQGFFYGKF